MAAISGKDGALSVSGGTTVDITAWTVNEKGEVANVTDSNSSTWSEFIPTSFLSWDGSFEGWLKSSMTFPVMNAVAEAIFTLGTGMTYTGNAIITGLTTVLSVTGTDAIKISGTLQGTGTLTKDVTP